jgi:hypothetical protein
MRTDRLFAIFRTRLKMRVMLLSTILCETFLILRRIQRDIINAHTSSRKVPAVLVRFLIKIEFSRQILGKFFTYQISLKSVQ